MARPLKFETPEELELKIQEFFTLIKSGEEEPTVIGLACHLNVDKGTLINYQGRPEYEPIITAAKNLIEKMFTARAVRGEIPPAMFIFISKNHYDYKDVQYFNHGGQPNNPVGYQRIEPQHQQLTHLISQANDTTDVTQPGSV